MQLVLGRRGALFAEDGDGGFGLTQPRFQPVAHGRDLAGAREVVLRKRRGGAEADDAGGVLGAAAQAPLLPAAVDERRDVEPCAHDERADPLGAGELVGGDAHHVDAEPGEGDRDAARRLHRVAMDQRAARACPFRDLGDRLDHAGLVVGQHDRDHGLRPAGGERRIERAQVEHAVAVHRQDPVLAGAGFSRPQHGGMLDGAHDQCPPAGAAQRGVVGLGAAGGEDQFRRGAIQ